MDYVNEILKEFMMIKDQILEQRGIVSVSDVLMEYPKYFPNRDMEIAKSIVFNTIF